MHLIIIDIGDKRLVVVASLRSNYLGVLSVRMEPVGSDRFIASYGLRSKGGHLYRTRFRSTVVFCSLTSGMPLSQWLSDGVLAAHKMPL